MNALSWIIILAILLFVNCQDETPTNANIDDIISGVFNISKGSTNNEKLTPTTFQPAPLKPSSPPTSTSQYKSCGLDKECVPRFLCQNDTINTDGTNIIDIRLSGDECSYMELCCDISKKRDKLVIKPVPPETHEGCGYRNADGVGYRITGALNNEAEFGEFPWMVAILKEEELDGEIRYIYECGGALIAKNAIITAAHCVKNRVANELSVRAGEWDTQTEAEILPYSDQRVKEIIVHEGYNKGSLWNDIAILLVEEPFEWEENIRPICLPESTDNFDNARCFTTGWGKDKFGRNGIYQSILKRIDLPIMPRDQCQTNLRTTRLGKYFKLHESFICAGGELGKDACTGDGGSPLVCPFRGESDRYYHAGIVAWGIGCGEENIPGVYASVPYMRRWIDQELLRRGIELKS